MRHEVVGWAGGSDSDAFSLEGSDVHEYGTRDNNDSDAAGGAIRLPGSPCVDLSRHPVHFYIDVPDADESTYAPSKRNILIDPEFQT